MDYKFEFYFIGFIVILILKLCHSQSERDVILTPKLALHVNGKTLYYNPSAVLINQTSLTNNTIPWEQALKHVTFLTLSNDLNETTNLNKFPNYERFMNSSYIQNNIYIPKFGDIITLAKGRLEINDKNEFQFIEGDCENMENCKINNVIASWQVQKIRHRDDDKKYRYEIKFTVTPRNTNLNSEKIDSGKREINNHRRILRAFVLKDIDYPKSFEKVEQHISQRRHDENRQIYLEKLNSFNDIFLQPRFFNRNFNDNRNLNIGEFMPESVTTKANSRTSSILPFLYQTPTTYRPQRYNFEKPYPNFLNNQPNNIKHSYAAPIIPTRYHHLPANYNKNLKDSSTVTTHLHHHYYTKNSQNKDHRGALDLIEEPLTSMKPIPDNFIYKTAIPITNQIPNPQHYSKFNFHHQHVTPSSTIYQQQTSLEPHYNIHNENSQTLNYQHNTPSIIQQHQTPVKSYYNDQRENTKLLNYQYNTPSTIYHQHTQSKPFYNFLNENPQKDYQSNTPGTIQQQQTLPEPYYNGHKENSQILNYHESKLELPPLKHETPIQLQIQPHNLPHTALPQTAKYYQQKTPRPLILSEPQLFYMQPIPISQHLPVFFYRNPNEQKDSELRNKNHFSEPDPLYSSNENEKNLHNSNYQQDELKNSKSVNNEELQSNGKLQHNEELLNNENENENENENTEDIDNYKPDSINAQLPPPDEGQDLRVPYVENIVTENLSDENSKAASSTRIIKKSEKFLPKTTQLQKVVQPTTSTTPIPESSSKKFISNLKKIRKFKATPRATIEKTTKNSIANLPKVISTPASEIRTTTGLGLASINNNISITTKLIRSTTERPILKWKPRNTKNNKQPTKLPLKAITQIEFERIPVTEPDKIFTVTPSKLDITVPTKQSVATSISYKIGNGVERPVVIPNLDIMQAKLIKLKIDDKSIKLFKAIPMEEENDTENSEKVERELQESIVEHVKSL